MDDGTRSLGEIRRSVSGETGQEFIIKSDGVERRTNPAAVVDIESTKPNFWRQLKGGIDVGYDFTSGNSQASLTTNANVNYETPRWTAGITDTTSFSGQTGATRTNLIDLQAQEGVFFKKNWTVVGLADFLHSSQQSLDLRTTLGGGIGRYLFRTNSTFLALIGGTVYTHENFTPDVQLASDKNIEGLAGVQYQLMRFNRYSLMSEAFLFPGLSDLGRIRATPKLTFNMKLENNFYTNLSFWDNYDSHPPANSKGNEFGISSGVGWTF
jgi:putative salt-induced outer membrane protein YdiY